MRLARTLIAVGLMGILGVGFIVSQPRAQDATPGADCPVTTPEQNAALARDYWEQVYNGQNPELVAEFLAEDFSRNNLARPQQNEPGHEDDVQRVVENLEDFPDLQLSVEDVVADADSVAVRLAWTGTQQDHIASLNVPPTGESATITVMAFYDVECGQLAEQWIVFDYVSMLQQLGVLTEDELATIGSAAGGEAADPGTAEPDATPTP